MLAFPYDTATLEREPHSRKHEFGQQGCRVAGLQGVKPLVDYEPIKLAMVSGRMNFAEASEAFNVEEQTIRRYAMRHGWPIPKRVFDTVKELVKGDADALALATIDRKRINKHIEKAFDVASRSVAKFKAKAPRNFHELDLADKIARRSAGIKDEAPMVATLIAVNEAIDAFEPMEADSLGNVIDGELMPDNPTTLNQETGQQDSSLVHDTDAALQQATLLPVAGNQGSTLPA